MIRRKSDYDFKKSQLAAAERFLCEPNISFIEKINLESRIEMIREELESVDYNNLLGAQSIVFKGDAVFGQYGIRADFVSKALNEIQGIVTDFFEQIGGHPSTDLDLSKLMITDVVRGSFGFEFEPVNTSDRITQAVAEATDILSSFSAKSSEIKKRLNGLQPKTVNRIIRLVNELHKSKSRLLVSDGWKTVEMDDKIIENAHKILANKSKKNDTVKVSGFFYILPASGMFEIMTQKTVYRGKLSKKQLVNQIDFFNQYTGKEANITLIKKTSAKLQTQETIYQIKGIVPIASK